MPWTVGDVDRFKKGLTDKQKRKWVAVANSALAKCQKDGGSDCDASAIRQANGSVKGNKMETLVETLGLSTSPFKEGISLHTVQINNYQIREETLEGRKHIVVPVVMMKEGVHNGSHGPIYHSEAELAKYVEAWNGIPITISHPEKDGVNVSANSPRVLETTTVGRVFNTFYNDGLRAEAWLDVEKLRVVSLDTLERIQSGVPLDVSVGVFSDSDDTEGEWHGETYESIAINYRPDHLALLPEEVGACSWNDGCGVRANRKGGSMEDLFKTFKTLGQNGYAVVPIVNAVGYQELVQSIQSKLNELDVSGQKYHYLQEVYDDYLVYSVQSADRSSATLYKRAYTVDDDGVTITFGLDSPREVRRKIEYVTMQRTKPSINNQKQGGKMACCEDKVDRLIANKLARFTAEDKEWLMTLTEPQIDKLSPKEPEKKVDPPIQVNKDQVIDEFKKGLIKIEDYTSLMPEAMKAQVEGGVKLYKEHRDALVKGILDNTGTNFSKEKLEAMDDETLQSIFKSVNRADYSGQGGGDDFVVHTGDDDEILLPAGVTYAKKKEE